MTRTKPIWIQPKPWGIRPDISKMKIDLYSDRGVLLKSDVSLDSISPLKNTAMQRLISLTKRTVAVNLAGIENALNTAKVAGGRRQIKGRDLKVPVVADADAIGLKIMLNLCESAKAKETLEMCGAVYKYVNNWPHEPFPHPDPIEFMAKWRGPIVKKRENGKQLLIQISQNRVDIASEYIVGLTNAAAATTEALIQHFNIKMVDAPMVHAAVWGEYPQTVGMSGGNIASVLNIPQNDEGLGFALRNVMANHIAAITKRNAMNAAALASIYEQIGEFEMGNAMGIFERHQLLGMAYQGLNADNMVYETVKVNGKTGTIGTVVQSIVARAIEDKVIKAGKKLPSGKDEYPGRNKTIENTRMVPVILSIASQDDLLLRLDGYSAKEIRKCKVARILREAYEQGGVLNQADVSLLIGGHDWKGHQGVPTGEGCCPTLSRDYSRYWSDINSQEDNHPAVC